MKKFLKRFLSIVLSVTLATSLVPASALASEGEADGEETVAVEEGAVDGEEAEADEDAEDEAVEEESAAEDAEDDAPDAGADEAEEVDATEDEDATEAAEDESISEVVDAAAEEASAYGTSTSMTVLSTEEDEKYGVKTEVTYDLDMSVATAATSSSNSAIRTLKVTRPQLTKTVKNAATGEVLAQHTYEYNLTVKVSLPGVGWVTVPLNSDGSAYRYVAASGKYIQAVNIKPSTNFKNALSKAGFSFYYRATSKYLGTLGWAKAGQSAGSIGNKCAMTKLTFKIASSIPGSSEYRYISEPIVRYKTKATGASSWNSSKANGNTSGKASTSYSVGSVAVKLDSSYSFDGSIKYSARSSVSDASSNWTNWRSSYSAAGCGKYKLKAIKIKLTGDMADYYNVYYRVYLKGYGWLDWAKNGEKAGSHSTSLCICAIQIKIVPKGQSAPGRVTTHYVSKSSSSKIAMIYAAQKYSSSSKYLIMVDRAHCRVGIFTGSKNKWHLKYYWQCCVGKSSTPTPAGSYTMGIKQYSFGTSSYTCYYASQISGNYLFHSVLYYAGTFKVKDGTMGEAVSHGCVRLTLSHAKWIYTTVPSGTKIRVY